MDKNAEQLFRRHVGLALKPASETGNPNGHLPLIWQRYYTEKRSTFIFSDACSVEENPHSDRFTLWKDMTLFSD